MPYLERAVSPYLKKRAAKSKCLLLTGARQVGKSTVIRHVFPEFNRTDFVVQNHDERFITLF